jgi:AcrR family transcriptional regulator
MMAGSWSIRWPAPPGGLVEGMTGRHPIGEDGRVRPVHPTKQQLIDTMVRLLDEKSPDAITTEEVLTQSGISRGSLYHHFEDFAELVAAAQVARFSVVVDHSITALTTALVEAKTRDDVIASLRKVTESTQAPQRSGLRFERATALAQAATNPKMRAMLGAEQSRLTDAIADLFREAQLRGFLTTEVDPRAGAVLIQAYTLGKLVDDIVDSPMSSDAWNDLIMLVITRVFMGEGPDPSCA